MKRGLDLKLLRAVSNVITHGSVTKAAKEMGLTPGAVSYFLNKAREQTGSHLFVRTKTGMIPDSTALELEQRYLEYIKCFNMSSEDSSENHKNDVNFHTCSLIEMMITSSLYSNSKKWGSEKYIFHPFSEDIDKRVAMFKSNAIDFDIGSRLPQSKLIHSVKLCNSGMSILMNKRNALGKNSFTINDWYNYKHITWSETIDFYSQSFKHSMSVRKHLDSRSIDIISGSLINMVGMCSASDYIIIVPDFIIPTLTKHFPVTSFELPKELDIQCDIFLNYHPRIGEHHELLSNIANVFKEFEQQH